MSIQLHSPITYLHSISFYTNKVHLNCTQNNKLKTSFYNIQYFFILQFNTVSAQLHHSIHIFKNILFKFLYITFKLLFTCYFYLYFYKGYGIYCKKRCTYKTGLSRSHYKQQGNWQHTTPLSAIAKTPDLGKTLTWRARTACILTTTPWLTCDPWNFLPPSVVSNRRS